MPSIAPRSAWRTVRALTKALSLVLALALLPLGATVLMPTVARAQDSTTYGTVREDGNVSADGRAKNDRFGEGEPPAFTFLGAEMAIALCPYFRLIMIVGAAGAVLRAFFMMFKASRGGDGKHWVTALVLLVLAGSLADPSGVVDLLHIPAGVSRNMISCNIRSMF